MRLPSLFTLLGVLMAAEAAGADAPRERISEAAVRPALQSLREREPADDIIYFLLPDRFANADASNDRGDLEGGRLVTGFDPASKAFYHGGDLRGVIGHLDYIRGLGATALWIAPVMKNKPVQGAPGHESAGYHGYWITDFMHVDPHLGTEADLHALIDAAHARGMKVILDIVANHTADVIAYRECAGQLCPYRPRALFATGYTPFVPAGQEHVKVPDWLNDPVWYHNRGNSLFIGESSEWGDFSGLDDLMTENPRVVQGFIEIYGAWIDKYRFDGYRIDTARHVNVEFWQAFIPAMLARAAAVGITNFYIFGEVALSGTDVSKLARYTRDAKFPAVLDFAFQSAVRAAVAGNSGNDVLARVFSQDALYAGGEQAALRMPTFIDNHDMGRFAWFVRADRPRASDAEVLKRVMLAHAMLLTLRGVPVIYYGDEQGFAGVGEDQSARQDMDTTQVAEYKADRRIGVAVAQAALGSADTQASAATVTAGVAFDETHPLYRMIAELSGLRAKHAALRHGRQVVRSSAKAPGLFAVSRLDDASGQEIVVAFNTATQTVRASVPVQKSSRHFTALHGECAASPATNGKYSVTLAPLDFVICASGDAQ